MRDLNAEVGELLHAVTTVPPTSLVLGKAQSREVLPVSLATELKKTKRGVKDLNATIQSTKSASMVLSSNITLARLLLRNGHIALG
jgi:hypothetical protein